jgi:hypothetical protein
LAKVANQASFSSHWQQLINEVTRYHAQANGIPARPKNSMFRAWQVGSQGDYVFGRSI